MTPLMDAPQVGDDAGIRRLLDRITTLEDQLRMVAAASAGQSGQVDFLLGQLVSAESAPPSVTSVSINPATSDVPTTWLDFDPVADAQVTLTTSSSGRIAVQAGGFIGLYSTNFCYSSGYIGVQILDSVGAEVRGPVNGDGNLQTLWGANNYQVNANSGHRHEWLLSPDTAYTLRCRRGYGVRAGSAGAVARIDFQGTAIAVTKVGM